MSMTKVLFLAKDHGIPGAEGYPTHIIRFLPSKYIKKVITIGGWIPEDLKDITVCINNKYKIIKMIKEIILYKPHIIVIFLLFWVDSIASIVTVI